jgi:toluene monooxygenase system protein E
VEPSGAQPAASNRIRNRLDQHWSTADQRAPWAMGPEIPMSKWYVKYHNQSPLTHADWDAFRDPDQLVYRGYNMI